MPETQQTSKNNSKEKRSTSSKLSANAKPFVPPFWLLQKVKQANGNTPTTSPPNNARSFNISPSSAFSPYVKKT